jgi:hypothetical protein
MVVAIEGTFPLGYKTMWSNQYCGFKVADVREACTRRYEFEGYDPSWVQHIYALAQCYVHCTGNAAHMCGQCRLHVHATLSTRAGNAVNKYQVSWYDRAALPSTHYYSLMRKRAMPQRRHLLLAVGVLVALTLRPRQ